MNCSLIYCYILLNHVLQGIQADLVLTKVECNTSTFGTCTGLYCSKDNSGTMSFGGVLTRDLSKVYLKTTVFVVIGTELRQIYSSPKLDWCSAFKGKAFGRFMQNFVKYVKEFAPGFVKRCPYLRGRYDISNLTIATKNFNFFPHGDYKNSLTISDEKDTNIYTLSHYTTTS